MTLRQSSKDQLIKRLIEQPRHDGGYAYTLGLVEGCLRRLDGIALPAEAQAEVDRALGYCDALNEREQEIVGQLTEA